MLGRWAVTLALAAGVMVTASPAVAAPGGQRPGTIIKSEAARGDRALPGAASATLLSYWSRGPHGEPMQSTGVLFVPPGTAPAGGWPIVSWAHGTEGIADHCAGSRRPRAEIEQQYLTAWLKQGYAVAASDYVGLGSPGTHPYLNGRSEAYSVIDMVRAARTQEPRLARKWLVTGLSQGGHAALHTGHIARADAPELDFRGTISMGSPSNLENLLFIVNPSMPWLPLVGSTAYVSNIFAALRANEPQLDINKYLSPLGQDVASRAENLCTDELNKQVQLTGVGQLMSRPADDPALVAKVREWLAVPVSGYDRPLVLMQGQFDEQVPAPMMDKLVGDLRANKVGFEHKVYPTSHGGQLIPSLRDAIPFAARVFS